MSALEQEIRERLCSNGAALVGFADLSAVDEGTRQGFPRAVSFCMALTPSIVAGITEGDQVEVELSTGAIRNLTTGKTFQARPLPQFVIKIAEAGGIVNFLKEHDIQELMA